NAWVEDLGEPVFLPDGDFLLASETSGWKHLYRFDKNGKRVKPVTQGEWEVRTVHNTDRKDGYVYFSGTKDNTNALKLYRCRKAGPGRDRLTAGDGSNAPSAPPPGKYFIDSHSDANTPTQVHLDRIDGSLVRTVDTNPVYAREEYRFGPYERVQIKTRD